MRQVTFLTFAIISILLLRSDQRYNISLTPPPPGTTPTSDSTRPVTELA